MRKPIALLVALTLGAVLPEAGIAETVKGDGFTADFPLPPHTKDETVDIGDGKKARMQTYQIQTKNTIYDVTIATYPPGLLKSIAEEQVLDNARDGAVGSAMGPLISETKLEYAGHQAREIAIDMTMNLIARTRFFIDGDRLVTVGATTNKDHTKDEHIEKFFASFKLQDAAAAAEPPAKK